MLPRKASWGEVADDPLAFGSNLFSGMEWQVNFQIKSPKARTNHNPNNKENSYYKRRLIIHLGPLARVLKASWQFALYFITKETPGFGASFVQLDFGRPTTNSFQK
jgi:hypothetical protein